MSKNTATLQSMPTSREIKNHRSLSMFVMTFADQYYEPPMKWKSKDIKSLLNIGNPAPFGFEAPQEIINDVALNLPNAIGYVDSKGIFPARKAICQYYQQKAS